MTQHSLLAILLAATALTACAGRAPETDPEPSASSSPSVSAAEAARMEAIIRAREDSARRRYTPADVRFMTAMIGHHAQAIDMARMAPTHGASQAVQVLAGRIINAQQDEIALMQRWLRERGLPVPEAKAAGQKMMMGGVEHEHLMPGMLTAEEMQQLDRARGAEYDRLFLTLMIRHHQGAVTMAQEWFGSQGAGQDESVFKLVSDVNVDQATEIARMQQMLAALAPTTR